MVSFSLPNNNGTDAVIWRHMDGDEWMTSCILPYFHTNDVRVPPSPPRRRHRPHVLNLRNFSATTSCSKQMNSQTPRYTFSCDRDFSSPCFHFTMYVIIDHLGSVNLTVNTAWSIAFGYTSMQNCIAQWLVVFETIGNLLALPSTVTAVLRTGFKGFNFGTITTYVTFGSMIPIQN